MLRKTLLAILIALFPAVAFAQGTGNFTAGHALRATGNGAQYSDGGGAAGSTKPGSGYLTELGITNTGLPFCINDALTNAANGYHRLCLGANALGGGLLSYDAIGGATPLPFQLLVNGTNVLPGSGGSFPTPWGVSAATIQLGPNTATVPANHLPGISFSDPDSPQVLPMEISSFNHLLLGNPFTQLPWLTCDTTISSTLCVNQGPILRTFGDLCCGDLESFGALTSEGIQGVQYGVRLSGSQPGGPTMLLSSEIAPQTDKFGGSHIEIYNDSLSSSGPGPLTLATISGIVAGGSGYVVGATPTIETGGSCSIKPVARALTVSGSGAVTSVTIDRGQGGVCTASVAGTITTSGGGGSGLTVTGTFGTPPSQGLQGGIQLIAYNSYPTGHQFFNFLARTAPSTIGQVAKLTEQGLVVGTTVFTPTPTFSDNPSVIVSEGDIIVQNHPGTSTAANLWFSTGELPAGTKIAGIEADIIGDTELKLTNYNSGDIVLKAGASPAEQMRVLAAGGIHVGTVFGSGRIISGTTDTASVTDCGKTLHFTSASGITATLPNNIATLECTITYIQEGAGQITFAAAGGATIHSRPGFTKTAGQWGVVDIILNTNAGGTSAVYTLVGDGA